MSKYPFGDRRIAPGYRKGRYTQSCDRCGRVKAVNQYRIARARLGGPEPYSVCAACQDSMPDELDLRDASARPPAPAHPPPRRPPGA